ncbi:MAG UNVERIFIED_CONTAM: hypothetical protein LVT10_15185 [Anaerolineae bacterium]|jgi:hypothetical protein
MQEQYTDAIDIYHEVAERYADGEDWEQYVYAHNNIGTTYEKMGVATSDTGVSDHHRRV